MSPHLETLAIHGGQTPDSGTQSCAPPLHRTAAYAFKSPEHAARLFALEEPGNIYTRMGNPTQAVLEQRMSLLEGGAAALALASGTAAIFYTIINLARQGEEIVSAASLYGGTHTMFTEILPQMGIKTHLAQDPQSFAKAITPKTRALYVEMMDNPTLNVADLEAMAAIAREHQLPLVVDSTFATPYLCRPLEHGADIVVHSLTKWLGGHGTAIGGVVVDGGNFDWRQKKFKLYNEPDPSYHNLRWAHDSGGAPPFITRLRLVPLRNLGACISPDNAWMFLQGLETLPLRMERHCHNAMSVAQYLQKHRQVKWVRYPGLPKDPSYNLASRYFRKGFGGMVVFGIKGDLDAGSIFIERLRLFTHLANVGDAKSLAIHPASTTHAQLTPEQQAQAGLPPELVRLSVGLEHIDDILADLEQALSGI